MRNGICRNCRKQSIFTKKADPDYAIPVRTLSVAAVYHFVCANCGYIENYILDDGKLKQISNNWEYVIPTDDEKRKHADEEDDESPESLQNLLAQDTIVPDVTPPDDDEPGKDLPDEDDEDRA